MDIHELWSTSDRSDLAAIRAALETGDLAGALFSIESADAGRRESARATLDGWADAVAERVMVGADAVDSLRRVLVGDVALAGERDAYYHPRNSALSEVIATRRGLPITLSVIWMLVGERAGLPVDGLALPGHFIVQVGTDPVDPFRRGQVMNRDACEALVRRMHHALDWDERWLDPVDDLAIVTRVLRNLANAWTRLDEPLAVYRSVRLLAELVPDDPHARLSCADVARQIGDHGTAENYYRDLAERFAETRPGREAEARLRHMQAGERWTH
jgi:regulator of sirC expression with transglutaminase-like and TPR domain